MNLMIVDDEKLLRNGFRHMADWESKGIHIVAEARNGVDALEQMKSCQLDVVLTDINMPIMNGIELTKQIKFLYPHIIVIILSGYDDYDFVRESMKQGASDYLLKASIDVDEIYELLHKLIINKETNSLPMLTPCTNPSTEFILPFDKDHIKNLLELQHFTELRTYILSMIHASPAIPIIYLRDNLRDLFFFIQYQLEQLNTLSQYLKERKYIHSSSVSLIKKLDDVDIWIELVIDELKKHCIPSLSQQNIKSQKIIDYIEHHFSQNGLSLSNIADHFFISKNYLCDFFKSQTNSTINDFIAETRINKAKELLRNGTTSLNEVAECVGYSDYNYFSRVFRKKMGLSPSEYQKIYHN